ncbi:MAG: hypothetical protein ACRDBL_09560 [Rhabdaerophilum sp.]
MPIERFDVHDILEWRCPTYPHVVHRWRVVGIHIGAERQESLIEAESITHEPGWTGLWEHHPRVFIPEPLTRSLTNLGTELPNV